MTHDQLILTFFDKYKYDFRLSRYENEIRHLLIHAKFGTSHPSIVKKHFITPQVFNRIKRYSEEYQFVIDNFDNILNVMKKSLLQHYNAKSIIKIISKK